MTCLHQEIVVWLFYWALFTWKSPLDNMLHNLIPSGTKSIKIGHNNKIWLSLLKVLKSLEPTSRSTIHDRRCSLAQYFCKRSRSRFRLKGYWYCISAFSSMIIRQIMCTIKTYIIKIQSGNLIHEKNKDSWQDHPVKNYSGLGSNFFSLNRDRESLQLKYWAIIS